MRVLSLGHLLDVRWSVGKAMRIQACGSGEGSGLREKKLRIINLRMGCEVRGPWELFKGLGCTVENAFSD